MIKICILYKCNVADRKEVFRVAEKVKKEIDDVTILTMPG